MISEIYILKKCLAERDRAVDAGLTRSEVDRKRISELETELRSERAKNINLEERNRMLINAMAQFIEKIQI